MSDYEKQTGWMRNTPGWSTKKTMLDSITGKAGKSGKSEKSGGSSGGKKKR